jgi:hypothetical protein
MNPEYLNSMFSSQFTFDFLETLSSDFVIGQILGLIIGIVGSAIFWYMLLMMKPKLAVSPIIAHNRKTNELEIKVTNKGRNQITDIQVQLNFIRHLVNEPGFRTFVEPQIDLRNDVGQALGPIQDIEKQWCLVTSNRYYVKNAEDNIRKLGMNNDGEHRLAFIISATHALSGTKVVQRITYTPKDIKAGKWGVGLGFIPEEQTPS